MIKKDLFVEYRYCELSSRKIRESFFHHIIIVSASRVIKCVIDIPSFVVNQILQLKFGKE